MTFFQPVCFIAVTELATVTPHFVTISVLISKVDFSLDVVVQKQIALPNVRGWTKDYQVEDDTEILIRYNVWGSSPKFWTGT